MERALTIAGLTLGLCAWLAYAFFYIVTRLYGPWVVAVGEINPEMKKSYTYWLDPTFVYVTENYFEPVLLVVGLGIIGLALVIHMDRLRRRMQGADHGDS